jgi:hypothetical protein
MAPLKLAAGPHRLQLKKVKSGTTAGDTLSVRRVEIVPNKPTRLHVNDQCVFTN